jgi:hypothetical protein
MQRSIKADSLAPLAGRLDIKSNIRGVLSKRHLESFEGAEGVPRKTDSLLGLVGLVDILRNLDDFIVFVVAMLGDVGELGEVGLGGGVGDRALELTIGSTYQQVSDIINDLRREGRTTGRRGRSHDG